MQTSCVESTEDADNCDGGFKQFNMQRANRPVRQLPYTPIVTSQQFSTLPLDTVNINPLIHCQRVTPITRNSGMNWGRTSAPICAQGQYHPGRQLNWSPQIPTNNQSNAIPQMAANGHTSTLQNHTKLDTYSPQRITSSTQVRKRFPEDSTDDKLKRSLHSPVRQMHSLPYKLRPQDLNGFLQERCPQSAMLYYAGNKRIPRRLPLQNDYFLRNCSESYQPTSSTESAIPASSLMFPVSQVTSNHQSSTILHSELESSQQKLENNCDCDGVIKQLVISCRNLAITMESKLENDYEISDDTESVFSSEQDAADDIEILHRQLAGLETMYLEVLKILKLDSEYVPAKLRKEASVPARPAVAADAQRCSMKTTSSEVKHDIRSLRQHFKDLQQDTITLAKSVHHLSTELVRQKTSFSETTESEEENTTKSATQTYAINYAKCQSFNSQNTGFNSQLHSNWLSYLTNPRRISKLKQFFGETPPFVKYFLQFLGYEQYIQLFEDNGIGILELACLTEENLIQMGIPLGPRLRILQRTKQYFSSHTNEVFRF